jgi:DNA-binding HxlR family transcriptional regulator
MSEAEPTDWHDDWHDLRSILGCKWTAHVLRLLLTEARGFNEIQREFDGLTATMLSRRLKQLTAAGMVNRELLPESPPRTRYELTEDGRELAQILRQLEAFVPLDAEGSGSRVNDTQAG